MRFDGHVKITQQALFILRDLGKRKDVPWAGPVKPIPETSTPAEHRAGVLAYLASPKAGLPELVAGVSDISNAHSHFAQELQRMHFMRASEETELAAYRNAVALIVGETEEWIRIGMETFWQRGTRVAGNAAVTSGAKALFAPAGILGLVAGTVVSNVVSKGNHSDAPLAKALHCLQDSFSPGHVLRSELDDSQTLGTAKRKAAPACFAAAPPIRRIFDYNHPLDDSGKQAKEGHDDSDYYAGSLANAAANAAAYASADLIQIALDSVVSKSTIPQAWTAFCNKWLAHKTLDSAPKAKVGKPDLEVLLQRVFSPAQMSCGRVL